MSSWMSGMEEEPKQWEISLHEKKKKEGQNSYFIFFFIILETLHFCLDKYVLAVVVGLLQHGL